MTGSLSYSAVDFDPFKGATIEKAGFTNESQKEIFLSTLIGGDDASRAYNEVFSLRFTGRLHIGLLEAAIHKLMQRHEALRSSLSSSGEYVFIHTFTPVALKRIDLSRLLPQAREQRIQELVTENTQTPFDLLNGPLIRFQLIILTEHTCSLLISVHHIIGDGWSVGVLLQDLGKFYSAAVRQEPLVLPPAPQMLAYASAEREMAESARQQQIQDFWLKQLLPAAPPLDMPVDFTRTQRRTYKSNRADYALPVQLVNAVQETGKKAGCSFVTTLLVAFEVFLYKLTGQHDIVLGLPAAGQASTGNTGLVGHCVNLLPLKSMPEASGTFREYLQKRKLAILDAYEHQHITFGSLLKSLNLARDSSRVPLVPVVFNVDLGLDNDVFFEGLTYELFSHPRQYETFELFVNISGRGNKVTVEWSYNTQLFKPETIQRFHISFTHILTQVSGNTDMAIQMLSLFDKPVADAVTTALNNTRQEYPAGRSLPDLLSEAAMLYAGNTALRFNDRVICYRELFAATNRLAHNLQAQGVRPGDKVGIVLDRSPELLMAILAVLQAGAVFLPLDPAYPVARTQYILEDVQAAFLITSEGYKGRYTAAGELLLENLLRHCESYPATAPAMAYTGNELAYILHTSGSTGEPKGVGVTHRNLVNLFWSMLQKPGITAADKVLAITSISFDIAYVELLLPLLAGAEIILADTVTAKDGRLLLALMQRQAVTLMQATPATWRMLIDAGWSQPLPIRIITGGEALPLTLARQLLERCGQVWNMYGPTETTIYATAKELSATDEVITIGRPLANMQVYVLNSNRQPVPQGTVGELYIGGDGVAPGYINKAPLTAERFIPDATGAGRLYKTGDLGRLLPNAEIQCLGRADDQIKIRGFRIEPDEIAFHLQQLPEVQQVVVHGLPAGKEEVKLVAYVVAPGVTQQQQEVKAAEWQTLLHNLLPAYMVPQQFVFVDAIPLNPNGKTDKKQLEQLVIPAAGKTRKTWVASQTKAQQLIAGIWQELLHVEAPGIHDDFFELGGHSLTAVAVMVRIEKETGIRLPIAALFEHATIEQLAGLIDTDEPEVKWTSLVPIKPTGSKTPVYMIHGSGLNAFMFHPMMKHFDADRPLYGIQAVGLDGTDQHIHSIEDIAARYIRELKQQNPSGPYIFVGYSLGGMIGLEMARQLKAEGKEVTLLGMIDTYVDNVKLFDTKSARLKKKLLRQLPKLGFIFKSLLRYPKDTIVYQLKSLKVRMEKLLGREEKLISSEQDYQNKIYEQYDKAYLNYKLRPYSDPVYLFKVKKRLYYLDDTRYMGWKPFAPAGIRQYRVPGDHKTFILPPNDARFVNVLLNAIAAAEQHGQQ